MARLHNDSLNLNTEINQLVGVHAGWERRGIFYDMFDEALIQRSSQQLIRLKGAVIYLPFADGHATYIVTEVRPLTLMHIDIGDGWEIPYYTIKGLSKVDIENMRQTNDGIFGRRRQWIKQATDEDRSNVEKVMHRLLPGIFGKNFRIEH